jgi:type IV pilus assembly protein PilQ
MRTWTRKTASFIFLAAVSVYPVSGLLAAAENEANPAASDGGQPTEVRLIDAGLAGNGDRQNLASQVTVSDAGTIEIHVNEASLGEVLRMLSLQTQKNIIASKDVRGSVTANLYNVTIKEALDAILKSNGYGYREKGNFIYVLTAKEIADMERAERQTTVEIFRLHYTPSADAVNMIKPVLSTDSQVSYSASAKGGIAASATDAGGQSLASEDMLVIRDYPENLERVRRVLKEIDRRPQQVLVEATIVAARLNENNALGIDFTLLGGVDFAGLTRFGIENTGDLLSGEVISANLAERGAVGAGTGFTQGIPQRGLRLGVYTNNIAVFLRALEETTDTAVLANPKVLTLNKQRGEVLVGREDGYLTTTVTQSATVQTVEFLKTGTRLIFRPFIGDDGYIRMEVHPEDSDGMVIQGLPSKTTTEVTTNVLVRDGHTIVIGGLFRESSARNRSQIPGLGNLPVVGVLFRNQNDVTVREEIVILLTPHIIKDQASYAAASEQELREMDRLRVGVRRGMMPWGRERLAEWCYENAVTEMNKPSPDTRRALWHLDCATNLNPKFLEAIRLKEQVSGRQVTTVDNSSIRHFVKRQILAERAAAPATGKAPAARPAAGLPVISPAQAEADAAARGCAEQAGDDWAMADDEWDGADAYGAGMLDEPMHTQTPDYQVSDSELQHAIEEFARGLMEQGEDEMADAPAQQNEPADAPDAVTELEIEEIE